MKTIIAILIAGGSLALLLFWYYQYTGQSNDLGYQSQASESDRDESVAGWNDRVLKIAGNYKSFRKIDDFGRKAPEMCWAPPPPMPRLSRADNNVAHGMKLYYLYARHRDAYLSLASDEHEQPENQVIVKEAWQPAASIDSRDNPHARNDSSHQERYTDEDLGEPAELFMMLRTTHDDPDGHEGWIYATVTANRKTVTSLGTVQQCIECHQSAPYAGLFGLDYGRSRE